MRRKINPGDLVKLDEDFNPNGQVPTKSRPDSTRFEGVDFKRGELALVLAMTRAGEYNLEYMLVMTPYGWGWLPYMFLERVRGGEAC